jgi:hypothetical protein
MTATLLNPGRLSLDQHVSDLGHDACRAPQHIACGKSKQLDTGREKPILAAIVLDQAHAMELTVVLESQFVLSVEEIWASKEDAALVAKRHLHLRTRQSIQNEQHAKASFHRRLRGGIAKLKDPSSRTHTLPAFASCNPITEFEPFDQSGVKRHVGNNNRLDQAQAPADVKQCLHHRGSSEPTSENHLRTVEDRVDWFAWGDVQTM